VNVSSSNSPSPNAATNYYAIVLAAGASRRFGASKLAAMLHGRALLDWALSAAAAAPVKDIVLVWNGDAALARIAHGWSVEHGTELRLVHATDAHLGLAASLRAGLRAVPPDVGGVFIFLGDMPRIPHTVSHLLAGSLGAHPAAAPRYEGRRGHPVLISRSLFGRAMTIEGDHGAGALLDNADTAFIESLDPGVLFDIDRPADLIDSGHARH
jgi:molybdenum cofactor cytidylyltransferase